MSASGPIEARLGAGKARIASIPFGSVDGQAVELFTLSSGDLSVDITNFGGHIVSLRTPDRAGAAADIVLGFDALESYVAEHPFVGSLIGRYANRIANGRFELNGKVYQLPINGARCSSHGGLRGFDKKVWRAETSGDGGDSVSLKLAYVSPDGEEGYPGRLATTVLFTLSGGDRTLRLDYTAQSDKDTVVNLTSHSYFNLKGAGSGNALGHILTVNADRFTPGDRDSIPTGEIRAVAGTPFDFRKPRAIGERIDDTSDEQIVIGNGYDHNFALNRSTGGEPLRLAARLHEPSSGRLLEVLTTQPGMQLYSGNHLDGTLPGKGGRVYGRRSGICLETQHFPDSPNHPEFPSATLCADETFRETTMYRFSTDDER